MARPLTYANKARILKALRSGATLDKAACAGGIRRRQLYDLRQADETFALAIADARESGIDRLEEVMLGYATGEIPIKSASQVTALFGTLKARRPEKWRDNVKVEHGNVPGQTLKVEGEGVRLADIFNVARQVGVLDPERDA